MLTPRIVADLLSLNLAKKNFMRVLELFESAAGFGSAPKPRRGRPPGSGRKSGAAANASKGPKRRRGRPRKVQMQRSGQLKRGPGRPRKVDQAAASAPVKRGPGRPRKSQQG